MRREGDGRGPGGGYNDIDREMAVYIVCPRIAACRGMVTEFAIIRGIIGSETLMAG